MDIYNIKPPLTYFSCKKGDAVLDVKENLIRLTVKGEAWMGLDLNTNWQASEFAFELFEANGICVTTGLGLGVMQTLLCLNPNVTKVFAYEKSREVIDIFYMLVEKNNFDMSKLEIINLDADTIKNITCNCLFLDHFEKESEEEIIQRVRIISENNNCNLFWYWPAARQYSVFCAKQKLRISNDSYKLWKSFTEIKKLPNDLTDIQIKNILNLSNVYVNLAKNAFIHDVTNQRNKLLNLFGSKK
jgi:hypothetical protein